MKIILYIAWAIVLLFIWAKVLGLTELSWGWILVPVWVPLLLISTVSFVTLFIVAISELISWEDKHDQ